MYNAGPKHIAIKGLDTTTDSFGVLPYTQASWNIYNAAGMFSGEHPVPAALIRSMLTWEKHMVNSTGASSFTYPFPEYIQPAAPPFSTDGASGMFTKRTAAELVHKSGAGAVLVTGLALDWCVLDSAVNARALYPNLPVYVVIDAARPSFLPQVAAKPYLKADTTNQCSTAAGGCWLHDPADLAKVLAAAKIEIITSDQVVSATANHSDTRPLNYTHLRIVLKR